ncbi:MAG: hypothetical protein V4485_02610, partial [Pseudomonadota bacterium]
MPGSLAREAMGLKEILPPHGITSTRQVSRTTLEGKLREVEAESAKLASANKKLQEQVEDAQELVRQLSDGEGVDARGLVRQLSNTLGLSPNL